MIEETESKLNEELYDIYFAKTREVPSPNAPACRMSG